MKYPQREDLRFAVVRDFLSMPHTADEVLTRFAGLPGAIRFDGVEAERFVYVPGEEGNPLLCAHADVYAPYGMPLEEDAEKFFRVGDLLGADDRAGCALLWEQRTTGCGMLIFSGEEIGCCASIRLCRREKTLCKELQERYTFVLTPDLAGNRRWKDYGCSTLEFRNAMTKILGVPPEKSPGRTDAAVLGKALGMNVCNLATGYVSPHTAQETLRKLDYRCAQEFVQAILQKFCRNFGEPRCTF